MKFVGKDRYWYEPNLKGNLDLPEAERLRLEIIRPTAENRDGLTTVSCVRKPDGSSEILQRSNVKQILRNHVGAVKNLTVVVKNGEGEEKEVEITSGEQLATASFYGSATLVSLVCAEVLTDTLLEPEKKS